MAVRWWEVARELVILGVLLAGYAWLVVLSARVRVLRRRLGAHICREPDQRQPGHAEAPDRVDAAEILRRERGLLQSMQPDRAERPSWDTRATEAADVTRPMPALRAGIDGREEGHRC